MFHLVKRSFIDDNRRSSRPSNVSAPRARHRLGFPVNKDNGCPLFAIEPTVNNVGDLLAIVKRVTQNQVVDTSCWFESGQGHHFAVRSCSRLFAEGQIVK